MKELRRNMRIVGTLVVVAFLVLSGFFALTVFEQGSIWASNSHNTRLSVSKVQRGDITDRDGVVMATTVDGQRVYASDTATRRALAVTLGDTSGMSGTGIEGVYSSHLLDLSDSFAGRIKSLVSGAPRVGSSVQLTVDSELTAAIASRFPAGYRGAVVVMNYKTGEILAFVSKPDYDPYDAGTDRVEDTAYLNRCLQGRYTPGSVFKIVTLASALQNDPGVVGQTFLCSGSWNYENGSIVCAGQNSHGNIDLQTAFARSCNVTFGKLAYQLGFSRLRATAEQLGFNENLKFDDFAVYNSAFPTVQNNTSELVWAGIGQGTVLVTPMHMALITSAVANNGVMMEPLLVRRIEGTSGNVVRQGISRENRRLFSEPVAQTIAAYMYGAVQNGTATRAKIDGYTVCGKTGSAETSNDKNVETNAWFTGFIYDEAHPYAAAAVVEQGGAGSRTATELSAFALQAALYFVG
ncbi:MAG: hypothetical protein MJ099_00665 [Clostridia bacterium]|nr:hypothetical protein [Clostridia bacterium]